MLLTASLTFIIGFLFIITVGTEELKLITAFSGGFIIASIIALCNSTYDNKSRCTELCAPYQYETCEYNKPPICKK